MQDIAQGSQPIARCECAVLPAALWFHKDRFRHRDVIWMVDNTVALCGLIKGSSKEPVNEVLIAQFWMAAFRLNIRIWLEYVDSKANWSDGISRKFARDEFVLRH